MKHYFSQPTIEIMNTNLPSNNGEFTSTKVNQVLMHMTCFDEDWNNVNVQLHVNYFDDQTKQKKKNGRKNVTKPSLHNSNNVLKHKQAWGEKFDSNLELVFLNEETSNGIHKLILYMSFNVSSSLEFSCEWEKCFSSNLGRSYLSLIIGEFCQNIYNNYFQNVGPTAQFEYFKIQLPTYITL
jgi:hypothetical protein